MRGNGEIDIVGIGTSELPLLGWYRKVSCRAVKQCHKEELCLTGPLHHENKVSCCRQFSLHKEG
jgi:hypothetical protein